MSSTDVQAIIDEGLSGLDSERLATRARAMDQARALIEAKLGVFDETDLRRLLALFNADQVGGRSKSNRFAPAFGGSLANKLVNRLPELNRWTEQLWRARGDEALARTLEEFWSANEVPGAGRSYPTMLVHVREPDRYPPLMGALASGFTRLTGVSVKGRTAEAYLRYVQGVRELQSRFEVPAHGVDVVLAVANRVAVAAESPPPASSAGEQGSGFRGFSADSFAFFAELGANNSKEWFDANRARFYTHIREPMRELLLILGEEFVQPLALDIEHEPRSPDTLSSIRKNAFGSTKNPYWTHYWAALHRRGHKKTADLQLYVYVCASELRFGLYTGSAPNELIERFADRLVGPEGQQALDHALTGELQMYIAPLDTADRRSVPVERAGELADLVRREPLVFARRLTPAEAIARGAAIAADVVAAFRALYPLWVLATAEAPESSITGNWPEPIDDAAEEDELASDLHSRQDLLEATAIDDVLADVLEQLLTDKRQLILYGPPGTGKTFVAEAFARTLAPAENIELVQFHPSYGYEDFVEGLRPRIHAGTQQLSYEVVPGIFRSLCERAQQRRNSKFVLIIDEINRGNLPRIFGELLYLLERRGPGHRVRLPISQRPFHVPENIIVIGTMNTADQSIALLDAALRRRFSFVRLEPDPGLLERWLTRNGARVFGVPKLLDRLNRELRSAGIDPNLLVGHSHFMRANLDEQQLRRIWDRDIMPLLEEYFYGQPDRLEPFGYDDFVEHEIEVEES